jgi:pimeloyl-ACP methyl ester carboxylesterase
MQIKSIRVSGLEISYFETNPTVSDAVIFIHGNSTNKSVFLPQLESEMFSSVRCLALDLPGHGASSHLDREQSHLYSLTFYAEVIRDFAHELGVLKPLLIGHSLGGHVAIRITRLLEPGGLLIFQAPPMESIEDLGLAFLPHPAGQCLFSEVINDEQVDLIASCAVSDAKDPRFEPILAFIKNAVKQTDPKCRAGVVADLLARKTFAEVTQVRDLNCPLCVVHGWHDPLVNSQYVESLQFPQLWGGGIVYIDGGHFPHLENADEFNRIAGRFIAYVFER